MKTGTSNDMRDNWCIGFSRRYTVGVWVGNAGGAPMHDVSGVTGAAPIWSEMMEWLHRDGGSAPPSPPRDVERTGDEWYLPGTAPVAAAAQPASAPRIVAPTDGAIIAIDPDIAAARQRVALEAVGGTGLRWAVDGRDAGDAATLLLWPPTAGAHEVAVLDAAGRSAASARFTVRGSPLRPLTPRITRSEQIPCNPWWIARLWGTETWRAPPRGRRRAGGTPAAPHPPPRPCGIRMEGPRRAAVPRAGTGWATRHALPFNRSIVFA